MNWMNQLCCPINCERCLLPARLDVKSLCSIISLNPAKWVLRPFEKQISDSLGNLLKVKAEGWFLPSLSAAVQALSSHSNHAASLCPLKIFLHFWCCWPHIHWQIYFLSWFCDSSISSPLIFSAVLKGSSSSTYFQNVGIPHCLGQGPLLFVF